MIKEKYKQLFLSLQFGGIRTITIHSRCGAIGINENGKTERNEKNSKTFY